MEFLHDLTIKKVQGGLREKKFSALELTQAFFKHIKHRDGEIGAFLSLQEDAAATQAEAVDIALAKGDTVSPLAGVPLAIKDNILIEGSPATAGSKILEGYTASYDATVITKLKKARSVLLGKTNLDEFAMGSSTENSAFQKTRNPINTDWVPGGSSGGSAAAVAATFAVASLGSDTGGSIRQPAAFCNVVGLKPTYGAVSRHGLIALASSLDQIGPFTKTVEDAAILFETLAGQDTYDATTSATNYKDLDKPTLEGIRGLRVGIPKEFRLADTDPVVQQHIQEAIDALQSLGVSIQEVSLPHVHHAVSCYYIILPAEASANLARFDGIRYARHEVGVVHEGKSALEKLYFGGRGAGFGPEVRRRILLGTFSLSSGYYDAYYAKAQAVRALITQDFTNAFKEVDVILSPTTPTPPFKIGEKANDPLAMYLSDIYTIPANLAGIPAISIPVRSNTSGTPVGFQLMGKHFHEKDLLGLGMFYEKLYQKN